MRKLPILLLLTVLLVNLSSCIKDETTWDKYEDWRIKNIAWLDEQINKKNADGTPYYTRLTAAWDKDQYILIRYINDTTLTENNLKPLYTSTVNVKYIGHLYDGTPFDSSYLSTSPADSVRQFALKSVIGGWSLGMMNMHVGDSCEFIIPYQQGYGSTGSASGTTAIDPYSTLKFNVRLTEIPYYERPS